MRLDTFTLRLLDALGNQATYQVEGEMSSTDDLYSIVGGAGDYLFYERTWTKGQPVKFSAMMQAVGTKDSGWKTTFFSMQTAAKNVGRPFEAGEDRSKMLVVNDAHFMTELGKVEADFARRKATADKDLAQQKVLKQKIAALDEKISLSWGKDANGKPRDRSAVQQEKLEKMYAVDRENDPLKFENHYLETVYEPALAACQQNSPVMQRRCTTLATKLLPSITTRTIQNIRKWPAKFVRIWPRWIITSRRCVKSRVSCASNWLRWRSVPANSLVIISGGEKRSRK
ncbi:DUF1202 family protein [Pseudocitrobacter faecalis]